MWRSQEVRRKRREKSWVNVKHRDAVEYADLDPETIQMKKDVKGLFQMIDKDMSGVITKDDLMNIMGDDFDDGTRWMWCLLLNLVTEPVIVLILSSVINSLYPPLRYYHDHDGGG